MGFECTMCMCDNFSPFRCAPASVLTRLSAVYAWPGENVLEKSMETLESDIPETAAEQSNV